MKPQKFSSAVRAFILIELLVVVAIIAILAALLLPALSAAKPGLTEFWQIHGKGQNILFADGHSKWYKGYVTGEMTFAYTTMTNWIQFP